VCHYFVDAYCRIDVAPGALHVVYVCVCVCVCVCACV